MKTYKYFAILFTLILGISACELPDNVDPKNATEVPIGTIYTSAQVEFVNVVDDVNVNINVFRLLMQYWQETTYFDEARYLYQDRKIPDGYADQFYRFVLMDFKEARTLINSPDYGGNPDTKDNMLAVIDIQEVYSWQCLVDAFGDMPYSEALMGADNTTPAYDDAATIYTDLISRLTNDLNTLNANQGSWGSSDLMYGGDVASWKRFGASLLLRLGMRLADYDAAASVSAVNKALSAGVFTSQDQSAIFDYLGVVPHVNAIYDAYTVNNRKDYLPTNTIIDKMSELNDPRLPLFFTEYEGEYVGAIAGLNGAQSYNNYSNFSDPFFSATFPGIIMDYVEVEFLLAEAAARGGYNVSGSAEKHYNNAIEASIIYWGGTSGEATTYLASAGVAWGTAQGDFKQKIGNQKWIALYNRGLEAWSSWRMLDYPILNVPEEMSYSDIPVRFPYMYDEGELNGVNYAAAAAAIGGDEMSTHVFWDKN